jgi:Flp pilus assembly protein TadB
MLRDTIAAHAGLREAIAVTARVAPAPIRRQVQALAVRAERESLTVALRQFAIEVADPVADLIVAALVIAAERQAQRLAELLSQIAASAREQSSMRIRVETGRARTYASSRALVVITFGLAVCLLVFSPKFMAPYDTFTGQIVMMLIGVLFAGALWSLVLLGQPATPPRLLIGVEDDRDPVPVAR